MDQEIQLHLGGGAGNPGGTRAATGGYVAYNGESGTGGLLVIYANNFENKGSIISNGSAGGYGKRTGGGGSGGGSINIFYSNLLNQGSLSANGGSAGGGGWKGGFGGSGCITIGNISTGTFIND